MKRADIKAGVLYAVKRRFGDDRPVMVIDTSLWCEDFSRMSRTTAFRPAMPGERHYNSGWGDHRIVGLPALERVPLRMTNPEYIGDEQYEGMRHEITWDRLQADITLQNEIPHPLCWEWRPTVVEPKNVLAPLDEHEAAQRAVQERRARERQEQDRETAARRERVAAIADVLSLDDTQCRVLLTRVVGAEFSLEQLEEIAGRLRQSSAVEVR